MSESGFRVSTDSKDGRILNGISGFSLVFILFMVMSSCGQDTPADEARTAYELRINGSVDEAESLLSQAVENNPEDALAYYELSRTLYHIGLGKGREISSYIDRARQAIDRAVEIEPENVGFNCFSARIGFLKAYLAMRGDEEKARESISILCAQYERILSLKPDFHKIELFLVEVYGTLPEKLGGDREKARQYADRLKESDTIWGAKAEAVLLPEDADLVEFWENIVRDNENNPMALEELGKQCLFAGKIDEAEKFLEATFTLDPQKSYILLDLARHHFYSGIYDESKRETAMPLAVELLDRYLETGPIRPLKAYATGLKGALKSASSKEEAERLFDEASNLDPYYPKASGVPTMDLYVQLNELALDHRYLFRPY